MPKPLRRLSRAKVTGMPHPAPDGDWERPRTLAAVVTRAATPEDLGDHLADFLDQMRLLVRQGASRRTLAAALRPEPPLLGDAVQDAYLAAVAAHLAATHGIRPPRWTDQPGRRLQRPWFALPDPWARAWLLRDSPVAFRERNLFTDVSALHRA